LIGKLTSETNSAYDWYQVSTTLRQLSASDEFTYANFWIAAWELGGTYPNLANWAPGVAQYGNSAETVGITAGTSGISMTLSWTHDWRTWWEILEQDPQKVDNWWGMLHHEKQYDTDDTTHDWDSLSFAATFKVTQGNTVGVYVGDTIRWTSGSVFDCWYPCHQDGPGCSPCKWYQVATSSSGGDCELQDGTGILPETPAACDGDGNVIPPVMIADLADDLPTLHDVTSILDNVAE
jgi:hypothetical protein